MTPARLFPLPRLSAWLLLGLLAAGTAHATAPVPLPAWEQLTAAQREQLIAPIRERWNAEPGQRQKMLERAGRWQQMTPEQRKRAHYGMKHWEHLSPVQRTQARTLFIHMRSLDPSEREAFKARWRAMTPEQQAAWLHANPAPANAVEHRKLKLRRPLPH